MFPAFAVTFAWSLLAAYAFWRLSLRLTDAGIVDILWGYGFGVLAAIAFLCAPAPGPRETLLLALVLLWSLRLGTHLWLRCLGREEDFRYQAMRRHHGANFGRRSLGRIFLFQATVQWVLSLPLQIAPIYPGEIALSWIDHLGAGIFAAGFAIEAIADFQLERFRRRAGTAGKVLDRGLWRYTRHPNYFGECVIAWGLFLLVSQTAYGPWFVWSPCLLTFLLTRVSGVPFLERGLRERLPGYADYMQRVRRFVPGPPRRVSS